EWFNKNRNLCRCTGYKPLIDAVMDAARVLRGEITKEDLMFQPTDNRIPGTSYARPSAAAKVTGGWDFGADEIRPFRRTPCRSHWSRRKYPMPGSGGSIPLRQSRCREYTG